MAGLKIPISVELGSSLQNLKKTQDGLTSISGSADKAGQSLGNLGKGGGLISISSQLKAARNELNLIVAAGDQSSASFKAASERVYELEKVLKDASEAAGRVSIKEIAPRFAANLGIVAGSIGNLAVGLDAIGVKGEDATQKIAQLQAILALSQTAAGFGKLQTALNDLGKDSVKIFQKLVSGIVSATGASAGLATALAATGIGVLAVAIGAAINAINEYNSGLEQAAESTKKLKEENERLKNSLDEIIPNSNTYIQTQTKIIANEEKIKDLSVDADKNQKKINNLKRENLDLAIKTDKIELSSKQGLLTASEELTIKARIFRNERAKERLTLEENKKAADDAAEANKKLLDAIKRGIERLDFRKFLGEAKYLELFGGIIERYKYKLEQLTQLKLKAKTTIEIENINKKIDEIQGYIDTAENGGLTVPLRPRVVIPSGGLIIKSDVEKAQDDIDKTFGQIFESAAENGIGSAAEAFGTALAQGGDIFAALGQSALTSLGDFAINVGKELLKIAITFEAIKKAFSGLGAGGKIAVAIALIAAGSAIKASVSRNAKKLATGGFVDGPGTETSDSVPARLSRGEYVIRARSVRQYGKDFFDKLNSGRFRDGGYVDPFASYSRALVNRMEIPSIFEPERSRALVNRPLPQVPTTRTGSVSMSPDNTFGGVIAETRISGQDLKIILSRADRRYSNVT
jgi:hypothetical protein